MSRPLIRFYDDHPPLSDMRGEILDALRRQPRRLPPKYFYDERGSQLFEAICALPEYYATRTELGILERHAAEIAALTGEEALLVELGSGSSTKVRLILEALRPRAYLPIDISRDYLLDTASRLAEDCPWLEVHATCMDYTQQLDLPYDPGGRKLVFFPGSSIGNFEPAEAVALLEMIAGLITPGGALLIGVDLKKDPARLHAAYNDAQGVTAAFNMNLLTRINRELGANFDPGNFRHVAFYDAVQGRIEMHLESTLDQIVVVAGHPISLKRGERIHTENSYKYSRDEFRTMGEQAGLRQRRCWTDPEGLFGMYYFVPA